MLARQAAAVVGVRTCWPWEIAATLPSAQRRKAFQRPRGRRVAGHTVAAARLQPVLYFCSSKGKLRILLGASTRYYNYCSAYLRREIGYTGT